MSLSSLAQTKHIIVLDQIRPGMSPQGSVVKFETEYRYSRTRVLGEGALAVLYLYTLTTDNEQYQTN